MFRSLLALTGLLVSLGTAARLLESDSSTSASLDWRALPSLPDSHGFAGMFAGVSRGALVVAGGANFPGKPPWENGRRAWHDKVFVLEGPGGMWRTGSSLPRALAYGVSITTNQGVIGVGGADSSRHYADVFRLEWADGTVRRVDLPPLPKPMAYGSSALVGHVIYVAGGTESPEATSATRDFWSFDLSEAAPRWKALEPWPGAGRLLSVAGALDGSFYLASGVALHRGADGAPVRQYLKDVYRYTPTRGWARLADLPRPVAAAPSPAATLGTSRLAIVGGDDGAHAGLQPKHHPGFSRAVLTYDDSTDAWTTTTDGLVARVTTPLTSWHDGFVIVSGEVRPGVRSPEVWFAQAPDSKQAARGYSIPVIDLSKDTTRQVVVDKERGQYLGHPTTVLLEDGKTMIAVYPKGHGRGAIVMKRSEDGGLTWSDRLPVPDNWATSLETPTIHRVVDANGTKRLILFSGLYPIRMSVSEDDGRRWTPLEPIGDFGGIVAMSSLVALWTGKGHYLAMFHDDGRFFQRDGKRAPTMTLFQTTSPDGGLTWSPPRAIHTSADVHLCEPGIIRSPDGKQLAVLLRENRRVRNSHVIFSNDEGRTWTTPRELPGALTGDRHVGQYARDGRLFISFRDTTHQSPTRGDWVAWVGTYDDIAKGREGQYRVRLMDNRKDLDCAYPGVEVLPDGTVVTTTYGHWIEGESPFIVSVRLTLPEIDAKARDGTAHIPRR